jgi:hypothetical protein
MLALGRLNARHLTLKRTSARGCSVPGGDIRGGSRRTSITSSLPSTAKPMTMKLLPGLLVEVR